MEQKYTWELPTHQCFGESRIFHVGVLCFSGYRFRFVPNHVHHAFEYASEFEDCRFNRPGAK